MSDAATCPVHKTPWELCTGCLLAKNSDLRTQLAAAEARATSAEAERDKYRKRKDEAYTERNRLVAVLSRLYPSHFASHDPADASWDREWLTIVCIHSPEGQLTWHIHDSQLELFAHLDDGPNHWDGHTTRQKYERVAAIRPNSSEESMPDRFNGRDVCEFCGVAWLFHGDRCTALTGQP